VQEVARETGLSPRFVALVESGRGNVAFTRLAALARALGVSLATLVREATGEEVRVPGRDQDVEVVALLGPRGAGKSAVGRELARRVGAHFVELDQRVELEAGLGMEELLALRVEDHLRRLEVQALERVLSDGSRTVLATGSGTVTNRGAMFLLHRRARTAWLRTPADLCWERVMSPQSRRSLVTHPPLRGDLAALEEERAPLYARADVVVDTGGLGVEQVATQVAALLGLAPRTEAPQEAP
jgi:XRE family aerobic/anaerobic benzoate catabolism transcriptional regulator